MFKALLVKEWKEKLPIAAFAAGLMVLFVVSFLAFGRDRDLRELIPAGFLIIFFPFLAVILGAGAFESEFRDGAWAFLLSRPVRKGTIWLAKLIAPASILAVFWLLFLGLMAVMSGLGNAVDGLTLLDFLDSNIGFLPLILLSSIFLFAVAFALSVLAERQFSLIFGSFFIGLGLEGLLLFLAGLAGRMGLLWQPGRFLTLEVFVLALGLSVLAVLAGSLITFRRADFSQPAKKVSSLAGFSALFLALSWGFAAAWPSIRPGAPEQIGQVINGSNGQAFFSTTKGLYRYDIARDRLKKIVRWRDEYPSAMVGAGDQALFVLDGRPNKGPSLWAVKTDGSGKRRLVGGTYNSPYIWFRSYELSPDGKRAIYLFLTESDAGAGRYALVLESAGTDGSGRVRLPPLDPLMIALGAEHPNVYIRRWLEPGKSLQLAARTKTDHWSLWKYDLATGNQTELFEPPEPSPFILSSDPDFVLWIAKRGSDFALELYNVESKQTSGVLMVAGPDRPDLSLVTDIAWSEKRDKVAFLSRQNETVMVPAVYWPREKRLVRGEGIPFKTPGDRPSLKWLAGDAQLIIEEGRSLKILGRDMSVERRIPVPESLGKYYDVRPCAGIVLVEDYSGDAVWRLDLDTEKWKRIW